MTRFTFHAGTHARAEWLALQLLGVSLCASVSLQLQAGPLGEHVVGGNATIARPDTNSTEIHQSSDRIAIDWQQFDVGSNEVVRFIQPSSQSLALNRILDSKQSLILGRLEANGRVFLVNPRGILFGKDAKINVASLVASSLDIAPDNFINGNFTFNDSTGDGVIVNQGMIEAAVGGNVVLLGKVVVNEGGIRAPLGTVHLVSAGGAVVTFDEDQRLGIQIAAEQQQKIGGQADAVRNSGTISAEGGYIALSGHATADLFTNAVNNEGVLVAKSVRNNNGVIELTGDEGNVAQAGIVDASASAGVGAAIDGVDVDGGRIALQGKNIRLTGALNADGANGGTVQLHAQQQITTRNNSVISAVGAKSHGGHVELLADRVGIMDNSRIDVRGSAGGGVVHVGGEFHGAGAHNAQRTVMDADATIYADATNAGTGGEVVLWSDDVTYFSGNIFARGGAFGGDGGSVEVSGKQSLNFLGFVDTSAAHGAMGDLLLDPAVINIINGSGGTQDAGVADGIVNSGDSPSPYVISEQALQALNSNVTLTATQQINIANLADNELLFNPNGGTVTFNVNGSGAVGFTMADTNDTIRVNNGNLVINGTSTGGGISFTLGNLETTTAGNIALNANATCTTTAFSACDGGAVTMNSGNIRSAGSVTIDGASTGQGIVTFIFPFFLAGNGGALALNFGDIAANGAVSIDATSTATGTSAGSGNASITVDDILVSTSAAIQLTANSAFNASAENVYIGGNYLTAGGNITISSNRLNLNTDALIDSQVFGSGGSVSIPAAGSRVLNGHTLSLGADDIYVGDISGSAVAGDLGFSQADIDLFSGATLTLRALGNIFVGNATPTGPTSALQLVADRDNTTSGDLSINSGKTLDLNGRSLTASGRNASINGSIVNSGAGSQQITSTIGAITLGSGALVASGSGNVALNAATALTMTNGAAITSISGQLALSAANNIALGSLTTGNATTSAVNVTTTGGAISNAGATTNIASSAAGSRTTLGAASGIDANLSIANLALTNSTSGTVTLTNDRTLQIASFTNTPATTASVTTTGSNSDLTIAGNVASGSNLSLISGGALSVTNGFTVNSNAGTLSINAGGDAAITGLTTTNNTASAVSVISGGAISDNGNSNVDITATQANAVVTLQAGTGIGAANALDLAISRLALTNSTSGAVNLTNNRSLQINSFTNTPATAAAIATTGGGSNITVAGNVASGGNLSLTSSGTFSVTDGFTVNSNAGTLSVNATGNAAITGLTTTNNTASAVSVISGGAISDNGDTNADITAIQPNAVVTLQAASGIGAANALDLSIANLALTNSTSGAVNLTNNRALQINSFSNTPVTAASIVTTGIGSNLTVAGNVASGSNLALTSSGTFGIADGFTVNSNAGTLSINAGGNAAITGLTTTNNTASAVSVISGGAISDNGDTNVDITATQPSAVVTLQAANGIGAANALEMSIANLALTNSTSGAVSVTNNRSLQVNSFSNTPVTTASIATTGIGSNLTVAGSVASGSNLSLVSSGTFGATDGFTVNSNGGTLSINATGNTAITGLVTTNNSSNAVSVISGGAITDVGDTNVDIAATQPNAVVTLQAASGVGAANALDLSIANLALSNSTGGAVNLTNNRALQINSFTNTPATAASVVTTGLGSNLAVAGNVANGGNLALTSSGTFNVTDGFTVNSNAGTLSINATGDAAITGLTTTNNTASAVSVISGGAITDNGDTNADITATQANAVVTLQAANGIGAANALDLSIAKLALTNSSSGAVSLTNNRALQISSFTNTPATAAVIATTGIGSNLTVAGNVASGSNLSLTSSGTFGVADGFTVNSNAGTLAINATGNAAITGLTTTNNTAGAVSVISGGAITDNGDTNADITATQPSAVVTLQAASGVGAANALDLSIAKLALTNSTSGAVNLSNNRALQINSFTNTPATASSIITTGIGSNLTVAGNVANGDNLALTSSGTFSVTDGFTVNSNAGTLSISATGDAAITGLTTTNNTASAISVVSGGAISDSGDTNTDITATQSSAFVTLQAAAGLGAANALELAISHLALTNSTSGAIGLTNNRALQINSFVNTPATAASIATTGIGSNLTVAGSIASGSDLSLVSSGTFSITDGFTVNSNAGTLSINAAGNAAITGLATTNNTASAISVVSGGAISDAGDTNADITATQPNAVVTLQAATGIGAANALELAISRLALTNSTSGAVNLTNNRALQINSFANTPTTAASIVTTGIGSNLTVAGNAASGSNLSLTSSGTFGVTDGFTVNSNTGTLSINATGNAAITGLTTTNNTASAVSVISGGAISDNGDANVDITATQPNAVVTLQAANGIGAINALDLSIANLALTNSTSGAVSLTNNRALQINSFSNTPATAASIATAGSGSNLTTAGNVASGSNLSLASSGTFGVTDGFTVNSNAGTLSISAAGNAAITGLATTNNTAGAVSVTSGGAISDAGDTNADISATQSNAVVTLQAVSGVGAANALDLAISRLALTNSTSGTVNITNNRALQINSFANTPATAVSIVTTGLGSNLTLAGNVASGSNLSLTSSAAFSVADGFTVNSNTGTLNVNATGDAAITGLTTTNSTANAVSVISGGAISDNGDTNADITAIQPNAVVTLQAVNGVGAATALDLSIAKLALTNSISGAVNVTNNRALQINSLSNTPATAASIVTTGPGSNMTVAGNVASGSNLSLTSSGTFGVSDGFTVNSNAGTLSVNAAGDAVITGLTTTNNTASAISVISGGEIVDAGDTNADITALQTGAAISLQAADGIGNTNAIDFNAAVVTAVNGAGGNIGLHALGNMVFNAIDNSASSAGAVLLMANGNLTANNITTANGDITLSAGGDLTLASAAAIVSGAGNIAVTADSDADNNGGIAMGSGVISTATGTVAFNASQDIALNRITTSNATAGAVTVTSATGRIVGNFDGTADIAATAVGAGVALNAATGIDAGIDPLELSVQNLTVNNLSGGSVNIANDRSMTVSGFNNGAVGNTTISVAGTNADLTFAGALQNGGGDVALTATRTIDLQDVAGIATLSTSSAAINFGRTMSVGAITGTGAASIAGDLTATTGNIDLQTVSLGAGAHAISATNGDINFISVTGNSNLLLTAYNIALGDVSLGSGDLTAIGTASGNFSGTGTIGAASLNLSQFAVINLPGVVSSGDVTVAADTINVSDDVTAAGAITLSGTTQLQNDVLLSISGNGNLLQLAGSVVGNDHSLSIAAAGNTVCIACVAGSDASDLSALDVEGSIKSVLGNVAVNGDAAISADQEIYFNGDMTVGGNLQLLADVNSDGIGVAKQLLGKSMTVGGALSVQPMALSTMVAAAQCAPSTGLPDMPPPPPVPPPLIPPPDVPPPPDIPVTPVTPPPEQLVALDERDIRIAILEGHVYGLASNASMLRNIPQIEYLNNCQNASEPHNTRRRCGVDASMMDFLGTFLIDSQIPNGGSVQ